MKIGRTHSGEVVGQEMAVMMEEEEEGGKGGGGASERGGGGVRWEGEGMV